MDQRIDQVMAYIFSKSYQKESVDGYGIGINGEKGFVKGPYYAVGWDMCLSHLPPRQELLYMLLLSSVSSARRTEWYQKNMIKYNHAVSANDNEYLFEIIAAARKTYWTSGCYLDFGRSRRERTAEFIHCVQNLNV